MFSNLQFDYVPEPDEGQRWSTWRSVVKGARGPKPRPAWVVTSEAAIDTELGVLKTGKEADVFLIERAVPSGPSAVMAAKRYRDRDHRQFQRDAAYLDGRRQRRTRDQRAVEARTRYGRSVIAGQWAAAEFAALCDLWTRGLPVPYPVQVDGTEILMEFIGDGCVAAPRLAQTRPAHDELPDLFAQIVDAMRALAIGGQAHGDLSPYNLLLDHDRVVMIDLPQIVDIVANPSGPEFLLRDCRNVCTWFAGRGLDVDPEDLFADLIGQAFG